MGRQQKTYVDVLMLITSERDRAHCFSFDVGSHNADSGVRRRVGTAGAGCGDPRMRCPGTARTAVTVVRQPFLRPVKRCGSRARSSAFDRVGQCWQGRGDGDGDGPLGRRVSRSNSQWQTSPPNANDNEGFSLRRTTSRSPRRFSRHQPAVRTRSSRARPPTHTWNSNQSVSTGTSCSMQPDAIGCRLEREHSAPGAR
jgi:hypothetical protein